MSFMYLFEVEPFFLAS